LLRVWTGNWVVFSIRSAAAWPFDPAAVPFRTRPLDEINSIGTEVDAAFQDGRVLWGEEFGKLKRPLKDCVGDFRLAWTKSNHAKDERVSDAQRENAWNETKGFLHASDENDGFAQRIRNAIEAIENYLAPHLGRVGAANDTVA